jgi:hypothetical protein
LGDVAIFEDKQTGFFVPKERATGFAIVSSVDAIRAPFGLPHRALSSFVMRGHWGSSILKNIFGNHLGRLAREGQGSCRNGYVIPDKFRGCHARDGLIANWFREGHLSEAMFSIQAGMALSVGSTRRSNTSGVRSQPDTSLIGSIAARTTSFFMVASSQYRAASPEPKSIRQTVAIEKTDSPWIKALLQRPLGMHVWLVRLRTHQWFTPVLQCCQSSPSNSLRVSTEQPR